MRNHSSNTGHHASQSGKPADAVIALSRDPEKAMREMIEKIETLRDIYQRENDALDKSKTANFIALQSDKLYAVEDYQNSIKQLLARRDEMKKVNPSLRQKMAKIQHEFSTLGLKNLESLERMKRCTERLGNTLRKAAKEEAKKQRSISYGAGGKMRERHNQVISSGSISETA